MLAYLREHLLTVFICIAAAVVLVRFLLGVGRHVSVSRRIDREGVVVWGTVSRVVYDRDSDGSLTRLTYVRYTDDAGVQQESPVALGGGQVYEEGDRLRIKFAPGAYDMVKPVNGE